VLYLLSPLYRIKRKIKVYFFFDPLFPFLEESISAWVLQGMFPLSIIIYRAGQKVEIE